MDIQGLTATLAACLLCMYLILMLAKLLNKMWWSPIRLQKSLALQGIKGPSYKFLYGSTKESLRMKTEATAKPITLSHNIFPVIQPDVYLWSKKFRRKYVNWHGPRATLVVTEPELVKEVLLNKDGAYSKAGIPEGFRKLLGNGLTTSDGEHWVKSRKLVNYALNSENLKGMIPDIIATMKIMLERWSALEGKEIDVHSEFRLFTSEVISRTAFGSSYVEGENIFDMLVKSTTILKRNYLKLRLPLISKIWRTKDEIEFDKLIKEMHKAVIEIVKKREEKVKNGQMDKSGSDLLGILLNAYHESDDNRRISSQDLIDECKGLYLAGHGPVANTLAWTILLLSIHTDWQEQARNEVTKTFGQAPPNPAGIAKLKIVSMIINETLRLYPPAAGVLRSAEREVCLGDLILPAEVNVYASILAVHHDTQIWGQDAHMFKPERFSEGIAKATNDNLGAFIPFGLGPRICVGLNFATIEAKIALSMILQRYSFTLSPTYVHWPQDEINIRPRYGVQVILHPLQN